MKWSDERGDDNNITKILQIKMLRIKRVGHFGIKYVKLNVKVCQLKVKVHHISP